MAWNKEAFTGRLDSIRKSKNITQEDLAAEIGVSQSAISEWKKDRAPSPEQISNAATAMGVREAWLAFGDEFEPMDDEEVRMVAAWRKLNEQERAGFLQTLEAVAGARAQTKKPGQRTKRALPLPSTHNIAAEFSSLLQQAETIERILADLLLHEALLPVGSKAQISVENASTLLDQLVASLRSAQQQDQQIDSAASSPTEGPTSGKQQRGHTQSRLPLSSPTDEKS